MRELHVRFGPVRTDQVDFGGQAGDCGQVTQGTSGNDGGVGVGQRRQGTKRDRGAAKGQGFGGDSFGVAQRSAVIAGHQEPRNTGKDFEFCQQGGGEPFIYGI